MNLKRLYGDQYQIRTEDGGDKADPCAENIPGKYGSIYVHGATTLGVATHAAGRVAKRLAALPGLTVVQDGTDGTNLTFGPEQFEAVAAIVQPRVRRKRRPMSEEAKARLVAAGAKHRFSARAGASDTLLSASSPAVPAA